MPATRARLAMAKSMFGSGRHLCLTSARSASASASFPDFGAAQRAGTLTGGVGSAGGGKRARVRSVLGCPGVGSGGGGGGGGGGAGAGGGGAADCCAAGGWAADGWAAGG